MKRQTKTREWWSSARIGTANDKRRRITDEDRQEIRRLHGRGEPIREIARIMEGVCSRRSIQFILFPERLERVKARAIEVKRWQAYNVKELHTPAQRKVRQHIREVHGLTAKK